MADNGKIVAYIVQRDPPHLAISKPKGAIIGGLFGAIGGGLAGLAGVQEGARIAKENRLEDPANIIAAGVAQTLAASRGGRVAQKPLLADGGRAPSVSGSGADYVVLVERGDVEVIYFLNAWGRYGVRMSAAARVLNGTTGAVLAKARCNVNPAKTPDSPGFDEMMADDAAILKRLVAAAGQDCLAKLQPAILNF